MVQDRVLGTLWH